MNRKFVFTSLLVLLAVVLSAGMAAGQEPKRLPGDIVVESQLQDETSTTAILSSKISYQGMLKEGGNPANGLRDMTFRLFTDVSCSTQAGSDIVLYSVPVNNGLFSVELFVDQSHFNGQGLWLDVLVYSTLIVNCEEILPVPYALSLRPGAVIVGYPGGVGTITSENKSNVNFSKGLHGKTTATSGVTYGVLGENFSTSGRGVAGWAGASSGSTYGVWGQSLSPTGKGIFGDGAMGGTGVYGVSTSGDGVYGHSDSGVGVHAVSEIDTAVWANSTSGVGIHAVSDSDTAVWAETSDGIAAVDARNYGGGFGVYASSAGSGENGTAVHATANHADGIAIWGESSSTDSTLVLRNDGDGDLIRGFSNSDWDFRFRVENDGRTTIPVLEITGGMDLSEQFGMTESNGEALPGMVVCIDPDNPGKLLICNRAYDHTVAGVISGAGGIEPGMVMGQQGWTNEGDLPVALTGRVYAWADASSGPIQPGDLLTTSDTPGYLMAVVDYSSAQGAIIGKAMESLDHGQALILILVTLQ